MTIDALLAGDWRPSVGRSRTSSCRSLTLGLINAGPILKMTQSTMEKMLQSDFSRYDVLCGMPRRLVIRHALRNALPSIVTIISVLYGFLIGGAVLVEIVFSWGGAGQYAVQGVLNSDINPVLGFVLFSAMFSLVVYLARRSHLFCDRSADQSLMEQATLSERRRCRSLSARRSRSWRSHDLRVELPNGLRARAGALRCRTSTSTSAGRDSRPRRRIGRRQDDAGPRHHGHLPPYPGDHRARPTSCSTVATCGRLDDEPVAPAERAATSHDGRRTRAAS